MTTPEDESRPRFPLAGIAKDGWSKEDEATATCYCGAVQLAFVRCHDNALCRMPPEAGSATPSDCSVTLPPSHQPTKVPGLVGTFVCHCPDCRKITASMFASNFTVRDEYLKHLRGQENLRSWGQSETIESGKRMSNFFCATCGTLMYRVGERFPGMSILRIGTVDDHHLHETKLRPSREIYTDTRVDWLKPIDGVEQHPRMR